MGIIIKKEMRHYFHDILLYIVASGLMLYCGFRFSNVFFSSEIVNIRTVFIEVSYILILFIPLLTMGSFASEKYNGTDRLLFSSAVYMHTVVWAKFFAVFF